VTKARSEAGGESGVVLINNAGVMDLHYNWQNVKRTLVVNYRGTLRVCFSLSSGLIYFTCINFYLMIENFMRKYGKRTRGRPGFDILILKRSRERDNLSRKSS
jgi:hypothetical protein